MQKHKTLGQVYTPDWIVDTILDFVGYGAIDVLDKYILEPSCGDGAFMKAIVNRYIDAGLKREMTTEAIKKGLETYIYGVELDSIEYKKCLENLNTIAQERLKIEVKWKFFNENTLHFYKDYVAFFDFVVGNPPYIRIHNLDADTKAWIKDEFRFSEGTIDIYLSFFELGLKTLRSNGVLGYITPNSFLHNSSYRKFRAYLKQERVVRSLVDFKANKVFRGFSTYTAISVFQKGYSDNSFAYNELIDNKIDFINDVNFENLDDKDWSFTGTENETFLKQLEAQKSYLVKDFFDVQYGFATLRDRLFIGKVSIFDESLAYFNGTLIERALLKRVVKGSRFKGIFDESQQIIFPYALVENRYVVIAEERLETEFPHAFAYFSMHREELERRDLDKGAQWYEYGRSQGVQSMHHEKIVISTLVNDVVEYHRVPSDVMMYSGLFIIKNKHEAKWSMIEKTLTSSDFYKYIRLTGKDFSGGYKLITSKMIKHFGIIS